MLARVGLPLLRSNSNSTLDGDSSASSTAASRSTITPGGPSPFPGERILLPTPPPGTSDPMAFLVDDSLSDLQKQKKYCLSNLPLQRLIFLRRLSSVARVFGVSATVEHLLPLLPRLATDKEDVIRQAVGIEVAALVVYLANPLKPQPQPVRPKLEDEEPWPEMWQAAADEAVPLAPPVYVHPKSSKPTPLDRTIATPVSPSVKSPSSSSAATPVSSQPASPSGQSEDSATKASSDKSSSSKGFFAKGRSLLTSARENLSASSSPSTSPPLTPTGTSSASSSSSSSASSSAAASSTSSSSAASSTSSSSSSSSTSASSSSSSSSTSSSVSSLSSSSSTSSSSTSSDSAVDSSDGSNSKADSASHPDTSSTHVEPSLSVNTASLSSAPSSSNSSTASSPSGSAASSPHAKPSSANRAPLSFDDPVHEIGYSHISTTLIPVIQQLLLDGNSEVRTAACDALVTAADVVREQDIGTVVLTSVLNLAHDERDEQRTTAVLLMHELAPKFGYDLCKSFVALELAAFADDAIFKVRKSTAQCFGNVCAVVGESFTVSKLLPCYVRLSKDLIWGVRKGCVESMVAVCRCVPSEVKREVFVPMFERFAKDNSRWVRNGAFEVLGPLLHVLGQELITRELLHHFTNIPNMSSSVVDAEVTYHAAFNFPAVLLALGPHHWEELLPLFTSLSKDSKPAVRRTIACSLHEIGHILGPTGTLQHVGPVMDAYLRDVDEVKGGVVKSFASLLRCLPADKREEYVEILWSVQKQRQHWRWRYQWARQLPAFSLLFSSDTTASSLIPLTFSLCRDTVAIVRLTASRAVGSLVKRLMSDNSGGLSAAISACKAFANGNTYMERQLFVHMSEGLIEGLIPPSLFIEEFLPVICALTADPIKNVRIALAAFFSVLGTRYVEYGAEREDVRAMIDKLRQDVDRDVRQAMMKEEDRKREAEKERALMEEMEKSRNESSIADSKRMDDDSDRELDEILGHSANDREEEAAERAQSMPRRLSASQEEDIVKIADMQQQLAKDGVREDKAENEILQPSEEKEMQRLPVDPIVLATPKKPATDSHMDVDSLKAAGDGNDASSGAGHALPHITLPVLTHSHARVSGHPGHVATPRASVSPHSFAEQLLSTDGSSGQGQGGGSAPMEVEESTNESPASDTAATAASDAGESMLTEDDQPAAPLSTADESGAAQADKNGAHDSAAANGSGDASNGGSGTKAAVDSTFAHQNGIEKHSEELQS